MDAMDDTTTTEGPTFAAAPSAARPSGGRAIPTSRDVVALLNVKDGSEAETVGTLGVTEGGGEHQSLG